MAAPAPGATGRTPATIEDALAALHRRLAIAEAAGDRAQATALRAAWLDLERRRLTLARADRPWRRAPTPVDPPPPVIDRAMLEAWLRGAPAPER